MVLTVILPVAMELVVPRALQFIIDEGIRFGDMNAIWRGSLVMLAAALVGAALQRRPSASAEPRSILGYPEVREWLSFTAEAAFDPRRLLDVVDVEGGGALATLLADRSIRRAERLALAIGGPAFQWR